MFTFTEAVTVGGVPSLTARVNVTAVSDATSPATANVVEGAASSAIVMPRDCAPSCVHSYVRVSAASGSEAVPSSLPTEPSYASAEPPAVTTGGRLPCPVTVTSSTRWLFVPKSPPGAVTSTL